MVVVVGGGGGGGGGSGDGSGGDNDGSGGCVGGTERGGGVNDKRARVCVQNENCAFANDIIIWTLFHCVFSCESNGDWFLSNINKSIS